MTRARPDTCRRCGARGRVVETRVVDRGYRRRRHACPSCGYRWNTYETTLHPRRITVKTHHM